MSTSRQIIQVYCLNHHLSSELAMVQADHDTPTLPGLTFVSLIKHKHCTVDVRPAPSWAGNQTN
jgi:hypothetical protein